MELGGQSRVNKNPGPDDPGRRRKMLKLVIKPVPR